MYYKIIFGTCSLCGGAVVSSGIIIPTPTCSRCGAVKADAYSEVIIMRPAPQIAIKTTDTTNV